MSSEDWGVLEDIALAAVENTPSAPAATASPAQIGGVLMHWAVSVAKKDPALRERILKQAMGA